MMQIYLKSAIREISKNRIFSIIHIIGLSTGIAAFVIILLYALYELSYDNFYKNADQIYRIRQDRYDKGKLSTTWGAGCPAIGPAIKKEFPEIADYARLTGVPGALCVDEKIIRVDKMYVATTSFLTMLPVRMLSGIDSLALNEPFTAVVSESLAKKYFGGTDVIGKTFKLDNELLFRITGVFADNPANTHLKFNILFSWPTYVRLAGDGIDTAWGRDGFYTYISLKKGTEIPVFEKKMNEFAKKQAEGTLKQYGQAVEFKLQPFSSIHLKSDLMFEAEVNGNAETVYFLMVIAILILIIAWVNYINLSTVKAAFRSREIAVRKISGASRLHLVKQFITESFTLNIIASVIAFILVALALPSFRSFTGKAIYLNTPVVYLIFLSVILFGPVLAGLYPAFVNSAFRPTAVFGDHSGGVSGSAFIRKALVIFQFAVSAILIATTFTVYRQLKYMKDQELGVEIDQKLIVRGPSVADSTFTEKMTSFKAELSKFPVIEDVTSSTCIPGGRVTWNAGGIRRASEDDTKGNQYRILGIDYDYVDSYGLSLLAGRTFSREFGADETCVLFNEAAVRLMGFETPESAIGENIYFWGNNYKIIGVLKNYHQESLKENYDALIFRLLPATRDYITISLNYSQQSKKDKSAIVSPAVEIIKEKWDQFFQGNPFEYYLLSDHYEEQYKPENQFMTIFGLFAVIAIIIACLGLFGLTWYIIARKTREIGIRKVNGATIPEIIFLVSGFFFRLVFIGIIIAAPVTYLIAINWSEKFAYRSGFSWPVFILSSLIIIVISAIAISYNVIFLARTNPAQSLRES